MEIPWFVRKVLQRLEDSGHEGWCVGGCVRDTLLGRTPGDWDVTTSALPEETLALFAPQARPTGLRHGTVTVLSGGSRVEVTTYRVDGAYLDHRRPDSVTFTRSLDEDLRRRDFTVNAMAADLHGELRDLFGGQRDLDTGVLRCVGDPDRRFAEDALRVLRGLRFASKLGFAIAPETAESLRRSRSGLRDVAPERILTELTGILCGAAAPQVLLAYPEVLGVFWPELLPMVGLDQRNEHHCYDVWEHSVRALEAVPPTPVLRYAALLHDVGKPECFTVDDRGVGHFYGHPAISSRLADGMLRRLRMDNATRERVVRLVAWHDRDIPRTDKGVRRALLALGEEDLRLLIQLKRADNLAQAPAYWDRQRELDKGEAILNDLLAREACFSLRQLAVNGRDMLAIGLRGPEIGRTLNALLEAVVDGTLPNDRDRLLSAVSKQRETQ